MSENRDRDTIVVKDGGSNTALLLAVIAIIIVAAGAWYFLMGPGAEGTTAPNDININVELPSIPAAS